MSGNAKRINILRNCYFLLQNFVATVQLVSDVRENLV